MTGGSVRRFTGTPKRLILDGVEFVGAGVNDQKMQLGATSFGRTNDVQVSNCTNIKTIEDGSASQDGIHGGGASTTMSMSNGIITIVNTDNDGSLQENPTRVFVPGTWLYMDSKAIFQVIDVTQDATNTYIQTSLAGTWPFTVAAVTVHPALSVTFRNNTGTSTLLEDLNQAPAGLPFRSYAKRTYVAGTPNPTFSVLDLRGRLRTLKINVTTVYTGAGSLKFNSTQFNNWPYIKMSDYSSAADFGPIADMKVGTGERIVNGAATASGAQSGDTLPDMTSTGDIWFYRTQNSAPKFSAAVTNGETPTVTLEVITDQGIMPAAVAPLRLRLHA
jgi:hypothetical protein